jgi:general secretion pathway protein D
VGGSVTATADSLIGPIPGVSGDGTLVTFEFSALAPGTSALDLADPILLDSSFNDITANSNFQNGSVTIRSGASVTPEPGTYLALCAILLLLTATRKVYLMRRHTQRGQKLS